MSRKLHFFFYSLLLFCIFLKRKAKTAENTATFSFQTEYHMQNLYSDHSFEGIFFCILLVVHLK